MSGREKVGRPKGLPKTGGRKRGTPNRSTLSLREKLAALDYDSAVEFGQYRTRPEATSSLAVAEHRSIART
jgi:hypothetical protein